MTHLNTSISILDRLNLSHFYGISMAVICAVGLLMLSTYSSSALAQDAQQAEAKADKQQATAQRERPKPKSRAKIKRATNSKASRADKIKTDLAAAAEKKSAITKSELKPQDFSNLFFTDDETRLLKEAIMRYQNRPKRRPRLKSIALPKASKVKPVIRDELYGPPQQVVTTALDADGGETVIIEQLPPVAGIDPRDLDFDPDEFSDGFGDLDDIMLPDENAPVREVKPGIRELRLGGILHGGSSQWIIWLNGMRVTPASVPEQVIDLKVRGEFIEIVWYDEYSELIFPIRLRPHERFNLDSRMFLPGIASK